MITFEQEALFFKEISIQIRTLVESYNGKAAISVQKSSNDYATEVDIAVENLIVDEINTRFPSDAIMAEEGHSNVAIPDGRIWIIDPICGTTNIGRGIKSFCTNIALADNHQLVASCVIDHSQPDFFWSIGDKEIYINEDLYIASTKVKGAGAVIDVDMGAVALGSTTDEIHTYTSFLARLLSETDYMPMSLNSSLGFAYTASGKVDGFLNTFCHPWDICASSFLIQQAGGKITALDGSPWTIETVGAIAAMNPSLHKDLLKLYTV